MHHWGLAVSVNLCHTDEFGFWLNLNLATALAKAVHLLGGSFGSTRLFTFQLHLLLLKFQL